MDVRFMAVLIRIASVLLAFHFSSLSDPELWALSLDGTSVAFCTCASEERLPAVIGASSRNGDVSESDDNCVIVGGRGDPSVFFARNPALKRLPFVSAFSDATGAGGTGESSSEFEKDTFGGAEPAIDEGTGTVGSIEDVSGV